MSKQDWIKPALRQLTSTAESENGKAGAEAETTPNLYAPSGPVA